MPARCPHCSAAIDIFKQGELLEKCPSCDGSLVAESDDSQESVGMAYLQVRLAAVFVGVIISRIMFRLDWLYVVLLIPLGFILVLAAQSAWDWLRNRDDTSGIRLK
jgi:hypothetical protein